MVALFLRIKCYSEIGREIEYGVGYPRSPRAHIKYSRNREKDKYLEEGSILLTGPETLVRLGIRIRSSGNYSECLSGAPKTRRKVK